ncbi:MAG TPA: phosphatase PAP2 family protein [Roseomonas sp.]|jgi:hypothetical protein
MSEGFLPSMLRRLKRDQLVYLLAVLYWAWVYGNALAIGAEQLFAPYSYLMTFPLLAPITAIMVIVSAGKLAPQRQVYGELASTWMLQATLMLFMGALTSFKNLIPLLGHYDWDVVLARIDLTIHGGIDPWTLFAGVLERDWLLRALELVYGPLWLMLLGLFPMYVAIFEKDLRKRFQFIVGFVFCWILLGTLSAFLFRSVGPAFYEYVTGDGERFGVLRILLERTGGHPFSAFDIQGYLWDLHSNGVAGTGSGISAFPSLHVSMATLIFTYACRHSTWMAVLAGGFVLIILCGSVVLGWHYAVDGYASIICTPLIWRGLGLAFDAYGRTRAERLPHVLRSELAVAVSPETPPAPRAPHPAPLPPDNARCSPARP